MQWYGSNQKEETKTKQTKGENKREEIEKDIEKGHW